MTEPERRYTETGEYQVIGNRPHREVPQADGEHTWVVMPAYLVNPTVEQGVLDRENLLYVTGPFCYWCEEPFSKELAARPCPGDVSA